MTTFRYLSVWRVLTKAGSGYRVVIDSEYNAMLVLQRQVHNTLSGFGEQVIGFTLWDGPDGYVANHRLCPPGVISIIAVKVDAGLVQS